MTQKKKASKRQQRLRNRLSKLTPTCMGMGLALTEAIYAEKEPEVWQGQGKKRKKGIY